MATHKFRGRENYNPNQGVDLFIQKLSPGSEDGEGYEVAVKKDGKDLDKIKLPSKKKVTQLIQEYKDYYNTDRAFLNGMHIFITYKNRESMINDNVLYKKAQTIEKKLNKLFNPDMPIIKRSNEALPIDNNSEPKTTEEVIEASKNILRKFIEDNSEFVSGEGKSKAFNAVQSWLAQLKDAIQAGNTQGINVDVAEVYKALGDEFGDVEFLMVGNHTASQDVLITLDEDDIDISTEEHIDTLIDSLNEISQSTKEEVAIVENIIDNSSDVFQDALLDSLFSEVDVVEAKVTAFKSFLYKTKFSGTLEDILASWVVYEDNSDMKYAKLISDFITLELIEDSSEISMAKLSIVADAMGIKIAAFVGGIKHVGDAVSSLITEGFSTLSNSIENNEVQEDVSLYTSWVESNLTEEAAATIAENCIAPMSNGKQLSAQQYLNFLTFADDSEINKKATETYNAALTEGSQVINPKLSQLSGASNIWNFIDTNDVCKHLVLHFIVSIYINIDTMVRNMASQRKQQWA